MSLTLRELEIERDLAVDQPRAEMLKVVDRALARLADVEEANRAQTALLKRMMGDRSDLRTRVDVLEKRIGYALKTANRRWDEWGDRAISVCEILEGGDPFADQIGEGG